MNCYISQWEIIRIPTDRLDTDAKKIPKAIDNVLEYRETNHINWRELYANPSARTE